MPVAAKTDLLAAVARIFCENPPPVIGVAVSGGGDSLALLHLAQRLWPDRLRAVTVDHGLRAESAAEAAGVAAFCAARGIAHVTLRWSGPDSTGNLMDQARRARAGLISDWARGQGVGHVLLGHTADDQAETLIMSLARAAGLDGLCGMRPAWREGGIDWHRPLLDVPRQDLRSYLRGQGIGWVDDPSNDNDRFSRVRARKALATLTPLGLTVQGLAASARHLAAARQALDAVLADSLRAVAVERAGMVTLPLAALHAFPPELQRRALVALIGWMGRGGHPPRAAKLAALTAALEAGRDATLGGVRFRLRGDQVQITRELRAVQGPVPFGMVWDQRWQVTGPALRGLSVAALGVEGLRQCPGWRDHGPRDVLAVTPALWQGGRLIAAPLAGLGADWQAETAPCLHSFILSH